MTQIKLRRDTSANFASKNPVLGLGEPAYETDTKKLKIGDGTTAYTQLEYFSAGGGGSANIGAALPLKIVNGVISIEVDGQTIQVVDGKLAASTNMVTTNTTQTITGNKTFSSTINGNTTSATKATQDGNGNNIVNTYATKTSLNTKADTSLSNLTEAGKQVIKDNSGSGLEICDIGMALYVDETKGLRRYLNGQIVDINTNTQAFLDRLKDITTLHPSLLCTEDEWQTAKTMSAFGQVGKFVFNYSGDAIVSVRLPRVVNVQGLFDLQNLGMTVTESLPNINGEIDGNSKTEFQNANGCFKLGNSSGGNNASYVSGGKSNFIFDASLSSSTYKDNAPVQPEAIQYPYFIQIATGSETENNIINEIELNNPYSLFDSKYSDHELNNLSWLKSEGQWNPKATYPTAYDKLLKVYNGTETVVGLSVKLSTEEYTDYDFRLNPAEETFRLPLKNHTADDGNTNLMLYFYVGETVQNANLIDAGRIGEQLANKIGRTECKAYVTETYVNGTSGYRLYSDKYIEQWGYKSGTNDETITFLKAFKDTNYNIVMATDNASVYFQGNYKNKTTTSMKIGYTGGQGGTATGTSWMVTGYIA